MLWVRGHFAPSDRPIHAYMLSTPGCWAAFGEVLAREYADPALFSRSHRWTVDSYAVQHPGLATDRRAVQSVRLHYAALYLNLEEGRQHIDLPALQTLLAGQSVEPLPTMPARFAVTHEALLAANLGAHVGLAGDWAEASFEAWRPGLLVWARNFVGGI